MISSPLRGTCLLLAEMKRKKNFPLPAHFMVNLSTIAHPVRFKFKLKENFL